MLTLPIKGKWFDMIVAKEKKKNTVISSHIIRKDSRP